MKEKDKIQLDLRKLTDRLVKVNETICDRVVARNRLDETIRETDRKRKRTLVKKVKHPRDKLKLMLIK